MAQLLFFIEIQVFFCFMNKKLFLFEDGTWSESGYNVIQLGNATSSVCYLINVDRKLWAAYRNCIIVINPESLKVEVLFLTNFSILFKKLKFQHVLIAHPRKDSQVRQMVWVDNGVWLTIRLDSTIRLYHSKTYQHLQDVDIEPYISKMLGKNIIINI